MVKASFSCKETQMLISVIALVESTILILCKMKPLEQNHIYCECIMQSNVKEESLKE